MKKLRKSIIAILSVFSILGVLIGFGKTKYNNVNAASPEAVFTYKTYSYDDYYYYSGFVTDLTEWFNYTDYSTTTNGTFTMDLTTEDLSYADSVWDNTDGDDVIMSSVETSKTAYQFYGKYPLEMLSAAGITSLEYTIAKKKLSSVTIPSITPKANEFNPGEKIVIETFVSSTTKGYISAAVALDYRMKIGNNNAFCTDKSVEFFDTLFADPNAPFKSSTQVEAKADVGGTQETSVAVCVIGGNFNGSDVQYDSTSIGAVAMTISATASGTYNILASVSASTNIIDADGTAYTIIDNPSYFSNVGTTIEVKGESTNAVIDPSSILIDGNTYISTSTDSNGKTMYTFDDIDAATTSVDLAVAAAERGTIKSVKYTTTAGSLTGTTATMTSSGKYTIPLGSSGTSVYAIIEIEAQTGGATEIYIVEIPRAEYNTAEITAMGISTKAGSTASTYTLKNAAGTADATFSSTTLTYQLNIPNNVTTITFTPTVNYSQGMTCKVDNNEVTSTTPSYEVNITTKTYVDIVVTSQDGSVSKTYKFNLHQLSTDTTISGMVIKDNSGNPLTYTTTTNSSSQTVYKVTGVDYTATGFTVTPTLNDSYATMKVDGTTVASGATSTLKSFAVTTAQTTKSIQIVVTSESLTTETYVVEVTRNPASTDTTLGTIKVYDNSGNEITGSISGSIWTSSTNVAYSKTGFYIKVTAADSTSTAQFKNSASGTYSSYTFGSQSATVSFSGYAADTKTAYLKVTAQDGSTYTEYQFNVTRDAANNNSAINTSTTKVYDNSGNEIAGTWSGNTWTATNPVAYSTTGFYINVAADSGASGTSSAQFKTTSSGSYSSLAFGSNSSNVSFSGVAQITSTGYLKVIAQDTTYTEYEFNVTRDAANNNSAIDTSATFICDANGNVIPGTWSGNVWTANSNVAYSTTGFYINVTADSGASGTSTVQFKTTSSGSYSSFAFGSNSSVVSFSGVAQVTKTAYIKVTAQNGTSTEYQFNVTREQADDDSTFTYTLVDNESNSIALTRTGNTFANNVALKTSITGIVLTITPTSGTTTVTISSVDYTGLPYSKSISLLLSNGNYNPSPVTTINVIVKTQYGTSTTLTFNISSEPLETDCSLDTSVGDSGIQVKGQKDNQFYTAKSTLNDTYEYELPKADAGEQFYLYITTNSSKAVIRYSTSPNGVTSVTTGNAFVSGMLLNCDATYYVTIFAEYTGSKNNITIIVKYTDTRDTHNDILNITTDVTIRDASNKPFVFSNEVLNQGTYYVPYSVKQIEFTVALESTLETLAQGTNGIVNLSEGVNTFRFQGKAENTTLGNEYIIVIERQAANTGNTITSLEINGNAVTGYSTGTGVYLLDRDQNINDANFVIVTATGATFEASYTISASTNTETSDFSINGITYGTYILVTINVKSEKDKVDGNSTVKTYKIYVICASNNADVDDIKILATDEFGSDLLDTSDNPYVFDPLTINNPFSIAYSAENPYFEVSPKSIYASVTGDGAQTITKSLTATNKTFSIVVKSEYKAILDTLSLTDSNANSKTYSYKITREAASTDNSLSKLEITVDGTKYVVNLSTATFPYAIENVGAAAQATVVANATDSRAVVTGDLGTKTLSLVSGSSNTETLHVYVESEAGVRMDYQIILAKTTVVLDSVNSIANIQVIGGTDSKNYITYNALQSTYNATIRAGVSTANIIVQATSSLSTIAFEIDGNVVSRSSNYIVALASGTTTTIVVKCTAQDGTENPTSYTINIIVPEVDTNATLSGLKVNGINISGFSSTKYDYTVNVENHITTAIMIPTLSSSNATLTGNDAPSDAPYDLLIGPNVLVITVLAEDGVTTQRYSVTVVRDAKTNLDSLTAETVLGAEITLTPEFDPATLVYTAEVDYDISKVVLDGRAEFDSYVTVTGFGEFNLTAGIQNKFIITIKAQSGAKTEYQVKITRQAGSDDNYITSFTKEDGTEINGFNPTVQNYTYILERNTIELNPAFTQQFNPTFTVSTAATYQMPANCDLSVGKNQMEITVVSQTGLTRKYVFTVYFADNNSNIDDIKVYDSVGGNELVDSESNPLLSFESTTPTYSFTVPYSRSSINLAIETENMYAKAYVNGQPYSSTSLTSLSTGTNNITIYAVSEYGTYNTSDTSAKSQTYTIIITREVANNDSSLSDLRVIVGGVNRLETFNSGVYSYTITNVLATSIEIQATATNSTARIVSGVGNKEITQDGMEFEIVVEAEDGSKSTYKLIILKADVPLDEDNTISYIEVTADGNELLGELTFSKTKYEYTFNIPFGTASVRISGYKSAISLASVTPSKTIQLGKTSPLWGTTEAYEVYATSQIGVVGDIYKIILVYLEGDSDATLGTLKVNGVEVPGFNPTVYDYTLSAVIHSVTSVDISAKPTSSKAVISQGKLIDFEQSTTNNSIKGKYELLVGDNTITILVTAENGDTADYHIYINRAAEKPTISGLSVEGTKLLDETNSPTTFDPMINKYVVLLDYSVGTTATNGQAIIKVLVVNPGYTVTCTQTTESSSSTSTMRIFNHTTLIAGQDNKVTITVSQANVENNYELIIKRKAEPNHNAGITAIDITEVPDFTYVDTQTKYEITVPNSVNDLNILATPVFGKNNESDGAQAMYINDKNLHVGENKVYVVMTAEDGITQKVVEIIVTREDMDFQIKENATQFNCTLDETNSNRAIIDLGKNNSSAISDYSVYIDKKGNEHLNITVINQDAVSKGEAKEVLLEVNDGTNTKLVTLVLSTTTQATGISFMAWVLLFVAIVLLIIILVTVMQDKYGAISKSRKKLD